MKKGTHPLYHPKVPVTCACGATFTTGSTLDALHIEVCSQCHPYYTGRQNLIDTAGRVDRFKRLLTKRAKVRADRVAEAPPRPAAAREA